MIRLLMRFGGSVTTPFPTPDNDSTLHYLTRSKKRLDLYLIFVIYSTNPTFFQFVKNAGGVSVYQLAVQLENRKMAKFLLDAMLFHFFPPWIVILQSVCLVFSLWILLAKIGLFWGILDFLGLCILTTWLLQQRSIIMYRDRVTCGLILGYFLSLPLLLYAYRTLSLFSSSHTLYLLTCYLLIMYLGCYKVRLTNRKGENQGILVTRIISSAPREGTIEENNETVGRSNNSSGGKGEVKVVKDKFTGRVSVIRPTAADNDGNGSSMNGGQTNNAGRLLPSAPRICSHCLLDKRPPIPLPDDSKQQKKASNSSSSSTNSDGSMLPLVHCQHSCNTCYTLRDHHCSYLMTCITITNRRLYVGLHAIVSIFLLIVYLDINWIETAMLCDDIESNKFTCLWSNHPTITLFGYVTLLLSVYSLCVGVILQLFLVARHITVSMIIKNKRSLWSLSHSKGGLCKGLRRVGTFIRTGRFKVSYAKLTLVDDAFDTVATATLASSPSAVTSSDNTVVGGQGKSWLNRLEQGQGLQDDNSNHSTSSHFSNYSNSNSVRVRRDSYTREAPTTTASPMLSEKKKGDNGSGSRSRRVTFQFDQMTVNKVISAPPSTSMMMPFEEEEKEGLLDDNEKSDSEDEDDDEEQDYEEEDFDEDDYRSAASHDTDSDDDYDSAEEDANSRSRHRDLEAADDDDKQRLLSSPNSISNNGSKSAFGSFLRWR